MLTDVPVLGFVIQFFAFLIDQLPIIAHAAVAISIPIGLAALAGTLSGVEMGLALAAVPHSKGGVAAALDYLTQAAQARRSQKAKAIVA